MNRVYAFSGAILFSTFKCCPSFTLDGCFLINNNNNNFEISFSKSFKGLIVSMARLAYIYIYELIG